MSASQVETTRIIMEIRSSGYLVERRILARYIYDVAGPRHVLVELREIEYGGQIK